MEKELSELSVSELKSILRDRGLKVSGRKDDLIDRILTVETLPTDVKWETLLPMDYYDVVNVCKTSKQFKKICDDERFWRLYGERRNWHKDLPEDTWRQTAILNTLGKLKPSALAEIEWQLTDIPTAKGIGIPPKDLSKILFREPITIAIPYFDEEKGWFEVNRSKVIQITPDTPVGSTLKHVLNSIYKGMWGSRPKENIETVLNDESGTKFYFTGIQPPRDKLYHMLKIYWV
jgi:hypothetical protein